MIYFIDQYSLRPDTFCNRFAGESKEHAEAIVSYLRKDGFARYEIKTEDGKVIAKYPPLLVF